MLLDSINDKTLVFLIRFELSIFASLLINLLILFTIPPSTTFGNIAKDALSLLVGGVVFFILLKRWKK